MNNNPAERAKLQTTATKKQRKEQSNMKGTAFRKINNALGITPDKAEGKLDTLAAGAVNKGGENAKPVKGAERDVAQEIANAAKNELPGELNKAAANVTGKNNIDKMDYEKAPEVKEPKKEGSEPITPKGDKAETEEPARDGYQEYENEIAAARGLGKYIGKDGKLDYNKLQRSKVGYGILNALAGALAGAGAGAAGQAAPDMSKGILGREIAKRDEVVEKVDEARRSKLRQDEDMSTFVKKLGLQGTENERIQKEMARFMSNLNFEDQKRLNNYLKNMPIQDAVKMGIVQNPYGFMNMAANAAGSFVGNLAKPVPSDEGCKSFAVKKVFR